MSVSFALKVAMYLAKLNRAAAARRVECMWSTGRSRVPQPCSRQQPVRTPLALRPPHKTRRSRGEDSLTMLLLLLLLHAAEHCVRTLPIYDCCEPTVY